MGKYDFERRFGGDDQKYAISAALIECHDLGRTVSSERNIHSVFYFNNAKQFSIDVETLSFNKLYSNSIPKSR